MPQSGNIICRGTFHRPTRRKKMRHFALTALPLALIACSADNATGQNVATEKPFKTSVIADFESPWAMAFLPDGRMLVTEKAGEMILFDPKNGTKIHVAGIPPVDSAGQGALMDVEIGRASCRETVGQDGWNSGGAG